MQATSSILRASRPAFRQQPNFVAGRIARNTRFQQIGRRWQSTAAPENPAAAQTSWFARMWNSPVGIKTVHFWAPVMKWALVLAGISDFYRPAEKLSLTQNAALTATGAIWTRWCFVIKPKNYLLAAVNFFLGCVGVIQVSRILMWQSSVKKQSAGEQLENAEASAVESAKGVKEDVKAAVKK